MAAHDTGTVVPVERHPSDSAVQRAIELVMLERFTERHPLWRRADWPSISRELGLASVWMKAEPDVVWKTETGAVVVAEAYSRVGILNEGQKRKLAKDALKLLAIQHALPAGRHVRCLLLVPDELVPRLNGEGWFPLALRTAAEIVSVPLTESERTLLLAASAQQADGQARTRRVQKVSVS
jgi:hypothetical protein